jgi:hypothetical protein
MPVARITCSLKNASEKINGISFKRDHRGMISEEVEAEVAARFAGIPGYTVVQSESERAAEGVKASAVELEGPAGTLHVAGDYSRADLDALRAHWSTGSIAMPRAKDLPRGPAPAALDAPSLIMSPGATTDTGEATKDAPKDGDLPSGRKVKPVT